MYNMRKLIYNNYNFILIIAAILALLSGYAVNVYDTGFFGGFLSGVLAALFLGLLVTPKRKILKES
jgi:hypothetical protein